MAKVREQDTPDGRIRSVLRKLWLQSRERASALKRDKYTCQECKRKQSVAKGKECKVHVHHTSGIKWDSLLRAIKRDLLCDISKLVTLCKDCHDKKHSKRGGMNDLFF